MTRGWAAVRSVLRLAGGVSVDRALRSGADAVALDLSQGLDLPFTPTPSPLVVIRVRADCDDLAAALALRPDAVLLPDCRGVADVDRIGSRLAVAEAELELADGATGIVASVADGAEGLVALLAGPAFAAAGPRLRALTWDAAGLAAAFGAGSGPWGLARDLVPVAARAAGLPALAPEGSCDAGGLRMLRGMGYSGKVTSEPDEVAAINAAFGPVSRV